MTDDAKVKEALHLEKFGKQLGAPSRERHEVIDFQIKAQGYAPIYSSVDATFLSFANMVPRKASELAGFKAEVTKLNWLLIVWHNMKFLVPILMLVGCLVLLSDFLTTVGLRKFRELIGVKVPGKVKKE